MTPERRKLVLEALCEIRSLFADDYEDDTLRKFRHRLEFKTDAGLTEMLINIEAHLERAQGTEI